MSVFILLSKAPCFFVGQEGTQNHYNNIYYTVGVGSSGIKEVVPHSALPQSCKARVSTTEESVFSVMSCKCSVVLWYLHIKPKESTHKVKKPCDMSIFM